MPFTVLVSMTRQGGVLYKGDLPWGRQLPTSLGRHLQLTRLHFNEFILDEATWNALPEGVRLSLRGRYIIISPHATLPPTLSKTDSSVEWVSTFSAALASHQTNPNRKHIERTYVTGESSLLTEAIAHAECSQLQVTEILNVYPSDVYIAPINPTRFELIHSGELNIDQGVQYIVSDYTSKTYTPSTSEVKETSTPTPVPTPSPSRGEGGGRGEPSPPSHPSEEMQYQTLLRTWMDKGALQTQYLQSLFGYSMRFNLRQNVFPLFSVGDVNMKAVICRVLWMLRGTYPYMGTVDPGPGTGFQLRHYGTTYTNAQENYEGKGVDQFARVLHLLRTDPTDKRILMSTWNPMQVDQIKKIPRQTIFQFYVAGGELSGSVYQQDSDLEYLPMDVAANALLLRIVALLVGYRPGELVYLLGVVHGCPDGLQSLRSHLTLDPPPFPTLTFRSDKVYTQVEQIQEEDITWSSQLKKIPPSTLPLS